MDTLATVSQKITSAELAQKQWAHVVMNKRIELIMRVNEAVQKHNREFVEILINKILKPKKIAVEEVERTMEMISAFCFGAQNLSNEVVRSGDYPGCLNNKMAIVERQPLGSVLCISPFNYPLNESMNKIIPAILMGNSVLFKPSSSGFEVGELIAECFKEAGFADNVFNLIKINSTLVSGSRNLLDFLVSHPLIDCVNFTGSTEVAEHIAAVAGIKKLVFGLSGKDGAIVLPDADLNLAAREISSGAFSYSGQRCTGVKRVLVSADIHDKFLDELKYKTGNNLIAGDLNDEQTNFGPVISEKQAEFIQELIDDAVNLGAHKTEIRIKNYELGLNKWKRRFILPTLLTNVTRDMRLMWEEPFGPVLPVMKFNKIDEAVKLCNQSTMGLQNSVFTQNINAAFKIADELICGVVNINGKDARGPDNFPFLGVKKSGLGVVGGIKYVMREMTNLKSTVINI